MQATGSMGANVRVRFVMPPPDLAPYITTFYSLDANAGADGPVEDWLHPEWANLRIGSFGDGWSAAIGTAELSPIPNFAVSGPTSLSTRFRVTDGRSWGIGLLPLGWAKFVGLPAGDYVDRVHDGAEMALPHMLSDLPQLLKEAGGDRDSEVEALIYTFRGLLHHPVHNEARITTIHQALVSEQIASAADLAKAAGIGQRTLQRFSKEAFGFSPQLLLRRQRFLRSLAKYMLDPSMTWIDALDSQYHDQAHFVRDFKRFMTMTPRQYAQLGHPILMAAMRGRMEAAGQAVQVLHVPE